MIVHPAARAGVEAFLGEHFVMDEASTVPIAVEGVYYVYRRWFLETWSDVPRRSHPFRKVQEESFRALAKEYGFISRQPGSGVRVHYINVSPSSSLKDEWLESLKSSNRNATTEFWQPAEVL